MRTRKKQNLEILEDEFDGVNLPFAKSGMGESLPKDNEKSKISGGLSLPDFDFEVSALELQKYVEVIKNKTYVDELHRFSDITQVTLVAAGLATISGVYKTLQALYRDGNIDALELGRIMMSYGRSAASINNALNNLGITGLRRDEESTKNPFEELLAHTDFEQDVIPEVQNAFINSDDISIDDKEDMLDEIKRPINIFERKAKTEIEKIEDAKNVKVL